ncbi:hypothetical protein M8J76_011087 [Diaphorina citri]|nr:hypothetical protein M8J75_010250 [Diaphorina citri]KAI5741174.1 hypothetical protein M8J76_011087 [Diaphorina citri]
MKNNEVPMNADLKTLRQSLLFKNHNDLLGGEGFNDFHGASDSSELLKINNINKNELSHEELSHHQPRMHGKNVVNPD